MENPIHPSSEHSANSAREKLSSYLGSQMKVVISDGRVLIGEFMCTDKDKNLILGNCDEYIPMNEEVECNKQEGLSRMLSLAIIPGHHISSIAVANTKAEPLTNPSSHKHHNQHENQHRDQNEDQREDQHEDQNAKEHESEENKNTIDAYTEEHGQTHEDSNTPQKHLTLQ